MDRETFPMDAYKEMIELTMTSTCAPRKALAYCDYIANLIQNNLKYEDSRSRAMLTSVGKMQYDLTPEGSFQSTKKTILVEDINGKQYRISVEEVNGD